MERRAINSILLDELQKIKGTNEIIEIKLQDNELFRISSEVDPVMYGNRVLWIITHALPSGRRYFSDTYSDSIGVILNIISSYPIKSINKRNGPELYSKAKLLKRMKELKK
jgi:hypothetical protein